MRCTVYALLLTVVLLPGMASLQAVEVEGKAKLAQDLVALLAENKFADVVGMFDDNMKSALPQAKLAEVWKSIISQAGKLEEQRKIRQEKSDKYVVVFVTCKFEKAMLDARVVFDDDNKVGGLFFAPTQPEQKPADKK